MSFGMAKLKFDEKGLIASVVQDVSTNAVLMMAYMNKESLEKTIETGYTWFYSRSRGELWNKGGTSGNVQKVCQIKYDCDADCLLVGVKQTGVACHTGSYSCFNDVVWVEQENLPMPQAKSLPNLLNDIYMTINDRRKNGDEKSYTKYLFMSGQDKILKKIGEEAAETIIASKNNDNKEVLYEMSDLWYHCLVLLSYHNINPTELLDELSGRRK